MAKSILGKYVYTKNNSDHIFHGHHGWIIKEDIESDEYHLAGGTFCALGDSSGINPVLCRRDFSVSNKQPDNSEVSSFLDNKLTEE
jgi:hypothetical protein